MKKYLCLFFVLLLIFSLLACGHEHIWQEATCTNPKACSDCGEIEGEALGHVWEEATCEVPKRCARCGETEGKPLGHVWEPANCLHPATCSVCGFVPDEAVGDHACENWNEIVEATCTEEGYKKGTCIYCAKEITVSLGMVEHNYGEWETIEETSCAQEGQNRRICQVCENEEIENVPKLEHTLGEMVLTEEPTYGKDGCRTQSCTVCNQVINSETVSFADTLVGKYSVKGDAENYQITDLNFLYSKISWFINGCVVIEVKNTGKNNLLLGSCKVDFVDNDGMILEKEDYACTCPDIVLPGKTGYFLINPFFTTDEVDISNGINIFAYLELKETKESPVFFETSDINWRGTDPEAFGRITNNTDKDYEEYSDITICALYRNEAGRVINYGLDRIYDSLTAGETVSFKATSGVFSNKKGEITDCEIIGYLDKMR